MFYHPDSALTTHSSHQSGSGAPSTPLGATPIVNFRRRIKLRNPGVWFCLGRRRGTSRLQGSPQVLGGERGVRSGLKPSPSSSNSNHAQAGLLAGGAPGCVRAPSGRRQGPVTDPEAPLLQDGGGRPELHRVLMSISRSAASSELGVHPAPGRRRLPCPGRSPRTADPGGGRIAPLPTATPAWAPALGVPSRGPCGRSRGPTASPELWGEKPKLREARRRLLLTWRHPLPTNAPTGPTPRRGEGSAKVATTKRRPRAARRLGRECEP